MERGAYPENTALFIVFAAVLLIAGYAAGLIWPQHFGERLGPLVHYVQELGSGLRSHSPGYVMMMIFINNWVTCLSVVVLGVLFGVFPAWRMWVNGLIIGVVNAEVAARLHTAWWKVALAALLPHGLFELTALACAGGLGLRFGYQVAGACADACRWLWSRVMFQVLPDSLAVKFRVARRYRGTEPFVWREFLARHFVISPPLYVWIAGVTAALAIAAALEATVTPWCIHHFL